MEEAGLIGRILKGDSLHIGGASAYANTSAVGPATQNAWDSGHPGQRWDYMYAYEDAIDKAGIEVAREKGETLAVSSYAQGTAPG